VLGDGYFCIDIGITKKQFNNLCFINHLYLTYIAMSSRFIQQQWKNVFISRSAAEAVSSDRKWALIIAPLVILANGSFYNDDDDDTLQRINKSYTNTLTHQCNRRHTVKCEAPSQHRRINERPTTSSIEHKIGGVGNNTKCRHRSVMTSKYDVDFKTVLGEGVSSI